MMKNLLSQRTRLLRQALKLNQTDFARQIGLTQTSLSMIEVGNNSLTDKNIRLICATFNVREAWLRDGEGEMFNTPSPYAKELEAILDRLKPETQEYLLLIARELLAVQRKLLRRYGALPPEDEPGTDTAEAGRPQGQNEPED